jgi:transposase-like protein
MPMVPVGVGFLGRPFRQQRERWVCEGCGRTTGLLVCMVAGCPNERVLLTADSALACVTCPGCGRGHVKASSSWCRQCVRDGRSS